MPPSPISSLPRPSWLGDVLGAGAVWEGVPESCPPNLITALGPPGWAMCWGWELPGRGCLRAAPRISSLPRALLAELLLLLWLVSLAHHNGQAALPEPATVAVMEEVSECPRSGWVQ